MSHCHGIPSCAPTSALTALCAPPDSVDACTCPPPPAVHLYHSIDDFGDDLDSDGADAMAKGGSYACDLLADGGMRKPATIYMGSCAPDESGLGTVGCGITVHDGIVTGPRATFVSPFLHHNPPRSTWEVARPMKVA
jgi:hypothetical protein